MNIDNNKKRAMHCIIIFGLVSLFGDIIYEGARSVNGPYLKTLAANAVIVGFIAGAGEFLGYAIRLLSGYFSDKTKAYWLFVFLGYAMLVSVPLLSLTGSWQFAAFFIMAERIGKALRGPARDTIVSQASKHIGTGFGFGIAEALDQVGAIAGPLVFTVLFLVRGAVTKSVSDYQAGYRLFWFPFFILLACIAVAYMKFPNVDEFESEEKEKAIPDKLSKLFWLYSAFSFMATVGFVNFLLIGYHFKVQGIVSDAFIPFLYAVAMGIDAIAAIAIGKAYDVLKQKHRDQTAGLSTLKIIPVLSIAIAFFAFYGNVVTVVISMVLWGVVMGAHETIMRSAIADLTPLKKRGTGYGIFNTGYGVAIFIGSVVMGVLYQKSKFSIIVMVATVELIALVLFGMMRKEASLQTNR